MFRTSFYAVALSGLAVLSLSHFAKADAAQMTQTVGTTSQAVFLVLPAQK